MSVEKTLKMRFWKSEKRKICSPFSNTVGQQLSVFRRVIQLFIGCGACREINFLWRTSQPQGTVLPTSAIITSHFRQFCLHMNIHVHYTGNSTQPAASIAQRRCERPRSQAVQLFSVENETVRVSTAATAMTDVNRWCAWRSSHEHYRPSAQSSLQ